MARVILEPLNKYRFKTEIVVSINDINFAGHLGNEKILEFINEARTRFFDEYKFAQMDENQIGYVVADASIIFKSEVFYPDTVLIEADVVEFNKYGCDLVFRLSSAISKIEIALAKTGMVFFDYKNRKVSKVTKNFMDIFG